MASNLAIYGHIAASRLRARVQYPISFGFQILGAFLFSFLDYVMILVIFHHLDSLGGWSLGEIAFLYGTSYVPFRIADILMTNLDRIPTLVRMGTFDQILTRPLSSLAQVMTGDLDLRHIGAITQGALVFAYSMQRVTISWTPAKVVALVVMITSAIFIFCSVWVVTNAIAIWTMDAREVANSFTYGGNFLTQFPLHIFGKWLRRLLAYVIPLAFVNYLPSLYILDKHDPIGLPYYFRFGSPVVALLGVLGAGAVWRAAIRHYRSSGS